MLKRWVLFFTLCFTCIVYGSELPKEAKIYVAGHRGLVGKAIVRKLKQEGYHNLLLRTSEQLDLTRQEAVEAFFKEEQPEYVILAAAKVGGIHANWIYPAQAIYENLMIEANVIHSAYLNGVKKLLFLGSSCIYPRDCPQPILESYLLTGPLEATNAPYALAKIAGINLCESYNRQYGTQFISCMPCNLYGPEDNFNLKTSHVLPALLVKVIEAKEKDEKEVALWGSGTPKREFLFVDDLADAALFLLGHYDSSETINVGSGSEVTIYELACLIKEIVGYEGTFVFDSSMPDGTPRKIMDVSRIKEMGWEAPTSLEEGVRQTVDWYLKHREEARS